MTGFLQSRCRSFKDGSIARSVRHPRRLTVGNASYSHPQWLPESRPTPDQSLLYAQSGFHQGPEVFKCHCHWAIFRRLLQPARHIKSTSPEPWAHPHHKWLSSSEICPVAGLWAQEHLTCGLLRETQQLWWLWDHGLQHGLVQALVLLTLCPLEMSHKRT